MDEERLAEIELLATDRVTLNEVCRTTDGLADAAVELVAEVREQREMLNRLNRLTSPGVFGSETEPDELYVPVAKICNVFDAEWLDEMRLRSVSIVREEDAFSPECRIEMSD